MTNKERLHTLVDELPEEVVRAVELFMEFALIRARSGGLDPVLRAFLSAPEDDEPLSPEEIAAIEEGRGDVVPWSEYIDRQRAGA